MLPARFTTADAFVDDIPFAVADACTEPDTFMNIADVDEIAGCELAATEPDTITGPDVLIPADVEPDTFPTTVIGAVVETAKEFVPDPPITFPFIAIEVPVKTRPVPLAPLPPVTFPLMVRFPAVCVIPLPWFGTILPFIIVLPFADDNIFIPEPAFVVVNILPLIVIVPGDDLDIRFIADGTPLLPALKLVPDRLKLQLPE